MVPVSEIFADVKRIFGSCGDDVVFKRLNRAVELLANKGEWSPLLGNIDITCDANLVTLPREIETILQVSYGDYPALGRDELFRYHLNGPGDRATPANFRWWESNSSSPVFRDLDEPAQVALIATKACDNGKVVTVYGYDEDNNQVRYNDQTGYRYALGSFESPVPASSSSNASSSSSGSGSVSSSGCVWEIPTFCRITRVKKPVTQGPVQLWSLDQDGELDTLLAVYDWDDTEPRFRRLRIDRSNASLVRIHYRRKNFKLRRRSDLIPLQNPEAVVMMARGLYYYDKMEIAQAEACEATALRWLEEEARTQSPPIFSPMQFAQPVDRDDDIY